MNIHLEAAIFRRIRRAAMVAGVSVVLLSPLPTQAAVCSLPSNLTALGTNAAALATFAETVSSIMSAILSMYKSSENGAQASSASATQTMGTINAMGDKTSTDNFLTHVGGATADVASQYTPSLSLCMQMYSSANVAQTRDNYNTQLAAKATAMSSYLSGADPATAKGPISTVAYNFQNAYLNNGFCDPAMPLPGGMTCAKPAAWPVNADIQPAAIFDEVIGDNPWEATAAKNYERMMMPIPPKAPTGDQLALPQGRDRFMRFQAWSAKASVVNWIVASSSAMGAIKVINGQNYSYRKALKEMAEGKFDPANPMVPPDIVGLAGQDGEKGNIQLVAYKVGNVQGQLLNLIRGKLEQIKAADALLLGEDLGEVSGSASLAGGATLRRE